MSGHLSKRPAKNRYLVVYDPLDENEKVYGLLKIDTRMVKTDIEIRFFNDDGQIGLRTREISKPEWETHEAFELFPILAPYDKEHVPARMDTSTIDHGFDFIEREKTVYRVRFRDY